MQPIKVTASTVISSLEAPSRKDITFIGKLCDIKYNANEVRVTEAFIDDIVNHVRDNTALPLCADLTGLINDRTIGHMYDANTGEFSSAIIGGLYDFAKEGFGDECSLLISCRVMKRYGAVCNALTRLFVENRLNFSFEINAGEYTQDENGRITIDASPMNYLEGVAVVTFPACEDAVARELVAECLTKGDEQDTMDNEKKNASTEPEQMNAENENAHAEPANTEQQNAETKPANVNAENAEQNAGNENANTQTAKNENAACPTQDDDEKKNPEQTADTQAENAENENGTDENACTDKKNASNEQGLVPDTAKLIAELKNTIENMALELASLKESIASAKTDTEQFTEKVKTVTAAKEVPENKKGAAEDEPKWTLLNPFVASIDMNMDNGDVPKKKYTLVDVVR